MKNNKRIYINTIMVTMLSLSTMLSPITSIHANETKQVKEPAEATTIKQPAPSIELPQDVSGEEGQKLQYITLPEHWTWVDDQSTLTKDTKEYSAKVSVDDITYDYSTTQGYNAEGHYVELLVPVIVKEKKIEAPTPIQEAKPEVITNSDGMMTIETTPNVIQPLSEPEPQKATNLQSSVNDEIVVEINETTFPDPVFRDYVSSRFDVNPQDSKLSRSEIELATVINMNNYGASSFQGIEYLTDLKNLYCAGNNITSLDVSENEMLQKLYCNNNGNLTTLTVAGADALEELYCYETAITNLDVSNNKSLMTLDCSKNENLTSLTVAGADELNILHCYDIAITSLDVSENEMLQKLYCNNNQNLTTLIVAGANELNILHCYDIAITSLDVSENEFLMNLDCSNNQNLTTLTVAGADKLDELRCYDTSITSLDVSGHKILKKVYCYNIKSLTALTVAGADELEELHCYGTSITSLDVSKNELLKQLDIRSTSLVALNIGNNSNLEINKLYLNANINVYGSAINMVETFKGFDPKNVRDLDSTIAQLDSDGVLKIGNNNTKVTYRYNSGVSKDGPIVIDVSMNITYYSGVTIANNLHYTGNPVDPKLQIEGSTKAPTIHYQVKDGEDWIDLNDAPVNVGNYRIQVDVPKEGDFQRTEFKQEFTISKANNELTGFIFDDLTYGVELNIPKVDAKFGDITLTYSDAIDGSYTKNLPTQAGTYYVKASVPGSENYLEHEEIKSFTIHKAKPAYNTPKDISAVYGNRLSDYSLPNGFRWNDETLPVGNAGIQEHDVIFTPSDTNNYEIINTKVNVIVSKASNSWIEPLLINDWTYGEQANDPHASAKFGEVVYTYSDAKDGEYTITKPNNAGTYYVKASVKNTSNFDGLEEISTFEILPRSIKHVTIPDITNDEDIENLVIHDGDITLELGTDYEVERKQKEQEVIVTITFKGNYTGVITKSYTVKEEPDQPSIDEPTNEQHGIITGSTLIENGKDGLWEFAGNYHELAGISLDGKAFRIEPINKTSANLYMNGYTDIAGKIEEGSVKITLYYDFLKTLTKGSHALEVKFETNGDSSYGETSFEINIKDEPIVEPEQPKDAPNEEPKEEQPKQEVNKPKETKEEMKPQVQSKENKGVPTGDQTQSASLVLLGLISLASMIFLSKKKRNA